MSSTPSRRFSLASVGRAAAFMAGATALVQVIGIVRELFLAAQVGLSSALDAVIIGVALPSILSGMLTAGARTALVPAYLALRRPGDVHEARRLSGVVLGWVMVSGAVLSVALIIFAAPAVDITGPGLDAQSKAAATNYLVVSAPAAFFIGVSAVLVAVCQAEELFGAIAWSIIAGPTLGLIILVALWSQLGLDTLAIGTLLAPIASAMVLLVGLIRIRAVPLPGIFGRGLGLRAFLHHAVPITLSASIMQFNPIVDRAIASLIAPGAISALRYGDSLVRAPIGAISPAWGAAIYPALVNTAQDTEGDSLGSVAARTLRFTMALVVPVAVLAAAVAPMAVSVLYGRGEFDAEDVSLVSQVLAIFAPLIILFMAQQAIVSSLNARRAGRALLAAGLLHVALNAILDVVFGIQLGIAGVALSSTVTVAVVVVYQGLRLRALEQDFRLGPVLRVTGLALRAAAVGGVPIAFLAWNGLLPSSGLLGLLSLAVIGVVGLVLYVVVARFIGPAESGQIADIIATRASVIVARARRSA